MNRFPSGLWPVMLTPFHEDNTLDLDALDLLTEFYISTGASGLFANCLSSEMFQLTDKERITITKRVVDKVANRIPVISTGTFSRNLELTSDFIKQIYETDVQAVIINTNQLVERYESKELFKQKIETILNLTNEIPLGLYECPVPYKRLLSPEILKWLSGSGRFFYLKDTSCNTDQIKAKLDTIKDTNLGLYNANVPTGLDSLLIGAKGLSPIGANFYPELFYVLQQNLSKANDSKIQYLNACLTTMDSVIHEFYPLSAKIFLQKRGLTIKLKTRTPVPGIDFQYFQKLDAVMVLFKQLAEEFEINLKFNV